ncbi:hypothetical protein LZ32DRAFT_600815 [Colletotrichum eremochloae]|nr:hypothetical protein LZ32DRAFT_600815 [Colletotrichum eremochloae]
MTCPRAPLLGTLPRSPRPLSELTPDLGILGKHRHGIVNFQPQSSPAVTHPPSCSCLSVLVVLSLLPLTPRFPFDFSFLSTKSAVIHCLPLTVPADAISVSVYALTGTPFL